MYFSDRSDFAAGDREKRRQHGSTARRVSDNCTVVSMSEASCKQQHHRSCADCSKDDCYVNGEVDCSFDVSTSRASSQPADDECQSCDTGREHKQNCEISESRLPSDASMSPGGVTDRLHDEMSAALTDPDCGADTQRVANSTDGQRQHLTSEVRSQTQQKLANGTDESYCSGSVTGERSGTSCRDDPVDDVTAGQSVKLCGSPPTASCVSVSESTRLNILDAAETFASIIGREIAASFDLKDCRNDELSSAGRLLDAERAGAGASFTQTHCSSTPPDGNSTRPVPRLSAEDRKCETDRAGPSGPALDTAEVARRVRDILTTNNVGQRQFARYVLGLSQGTVSELLAKPKPWDRLTEKGKESYRRMSQWAGDHLGVMSLKGHLNSVALKANLPSPKGFVFAFSVLIAYD